MKKFLRQERTALPSFFHFLFISMAVLLVESCTKKDPPAPVLNITTLASGFINPIGVETDKAGRIWISQSGSGLNDGKVTMITKEGTKYDVITNFESVTSEGGEPDGPSHLLFADGLLYILGTNGKMYKADVSAYKPGDAPIKASSLGVEDIGSFVRAYKFQDDTGESHTYNLTSGPNGAIYITDAAANAIVRRDKTGALSILAAVPGIPNPTPVGPPRIESVPTGILYDGKDFLVTNLLGFPFPAGKALIYKVSTTGTITTYQQAFNSLVDIADGGPLGRLVLEHGTFGPTGFMPKTGRLVWATGSSISVLAEGLNLPVGLNQANEHTWYVTSVGDGSVLKVTY